MLKCLHENSKPPLSFISHLSTSDRKSISQSRPLYAVPQYRNLKKSSRYILLPTRTPRLIVIRGFGSILGLISDSKIYYVPQKTNQREEEVVVEVQAVYARSLALIRHSVRVLPIEADSQRASERFVNRNVCVKSNARALNLTRRRFSL